MSDKTTTNLPLDEGQLESSGSNLAVTHDDISSAVGSIKVEKQTYPRSSISSDRQSKFERAQKCLENAALVSKRIKEHRKATAELLGRPFESDDAGDCNSEMASVISEKTGYSTTTETSTTLSVQDALNIPGISESLANTLRQKELLMERIKQYKEISKRPIIKPAPTTLKKASDTKTESMKLKVADSNEIKSLQNTIREKDNALTTLQVKIKTMETAILDLQEKISEKDQILEAKNKATTLISDTLNKKEKDTLALLEDTRQQMTKMQENFIFMENEWKSEKENYVTLIQAKDKQISSLEESNKILENSKIELSETYSKLTKELEERNNELSNLTNQIRQLSEPKKQEETLEVEEEKGVKEVTDMEEFSKKIELLEILNSQLRLSNKELENKLSIITTDTKLPVSSSPIKKSSPLTARKGGRNTASKSKSPWSNMAPDSALQDAEKKADKNESVKFDAIIQSLNKDILDKEIIILQKEIQIKELETRISSHEDVIKELQNKIQENNKGPDKIDIGLCTESENINVLTELEPQPSSDHDLQNQDQSLQKELTAAQELIAVLTNEIDAANKNMIKVKSAHKLKLKQMQKTIDNFSKISDSNAEITRLNEEMHKLSQKVAELEEEKGNLQLHLVDYDGGRLTESDIYKKMIEMEHLAEARLKAISVLETQKFDLVQELHVVQQKYLEMEDKLADMAQLQNEQVCSEMKSVQLEEEIDELVASKKELELVIENLKLDKEQLNRNIKSLQSEKYDLNQKLEHYLQENIELTDRLEKLSAEKVSSAESIEIVESLTTQEKLELEEYSKAMSECKPSDMHVEEYKTNIECNENIEKLVEESAELNKKIELFTQERQEVMEKMNKISTENDLLQQTLADLHSQYSALESNIKELSKEKDILQSLNEELCRQIEELKRERIEIIKDHVEVNKPSSMDDAIEGIITEVSTDEKLTTDKGSKGTKSVKQLTKEILKLKNTIKEREAEIGDCQMKILSLEEQHQKQSESIQYNLGSESKIKSLIDENNCLKNEIEQYKSQDNNDKIQNNTLQKSLENIQQEYQNTVVARDARIQELENLLLEYEKQIINYSNTVQQKDKEMAEYINQITKLNDVSQKLKSTVELLEEEKSKDPNAELVKTLNKQILGYQKKLTECGDRILKLEEEKSELTIAKNTLDNKNVSLDAELNKLKENFAEKQNLLSELQTQNNKHDDEMSMIMAQTKERDEEIHAIKLQLRKESIENEKLHNSLIESENTIKKLNAIVENSDKNYQKVNLEKDNLNQQCILLENKNKELLEKLKKFAASIKKKSGLYTELEEQYNESQKKLQAKIEQLEQLNILVESIPCLKEKLAHAEEQLNRLHAQKSVFEQQNTEAAIKLKDDLKASSDQLNSALNNLSSMHITIENKNKELALMREENQSHLLQIEMLTNKITDYEVEQKNSANYATKINSLEIEINKKQNLINDLLNKIEFQEIQISQNLAKMQERDLYIETLDTEINKYKNRISRLEESVSVMENRRHSLETKADLLDVQLREKQKAYTDYTNQEDDLINRLAVLMDHDREFEDNLLAIQSENKKLLECTHNLKDENHYLKHTLNELQHANNMLVEKTKRTEDVESDVVKYQSELKDCETQLKKISQEHQILLTKNKQDIEDLELEFNTQIKNAIKEKKNLSEKYEKVIEHVDQLEAKLQEYRSNIQNLTINIEELTQINQNLIHKSKHREEEPAANYTEQYIMEINKLNSVLNSKNTEIVELKNKQENVQYQNVSIVTSFTAQITELNSKLENAQLEIERLTRDIASLKELNSRLQILLSEKEEQLKQLLDRKKVTFEMNIPKTEGMIISSTIEALNVSSEGADCASLDSQIIPNTSPDDVHKVKHEKEPLSYYTDPTQGCVEEQIIPKKAYLCFEKVQSTVVENDPFNSDEGWGLDSVEEELEFTPTSVSLDRQIQNLEKEKQFLKSELDTSNNKLMKAMKKLKELKSQNDIISKELKLTKEISQTSFLDTAIEDELKNSIQDLEKRNNDLALEFSREKGEKEKLQKQNEVFNTANEKLMEIKEKLDSEIELWKFKFKEVNDKMCSMLWDTESKDPTHHTLLTSRDASAEESRLKAEIIKLEKENDETQEMIDQLKLENEQLQKKQKELHLELEQLHRRMGETRTCNNCESLHKSLVLKQTDIDEAKVINDAKIKELKESYDSAIEKNQELESEIQKLLSEKQTVCDLQNEIDKLKQEIKNIGIVESQLQITNSSLLSELDLTKSKLLESEEQLKTNNSVNSETLQLVEKIKIVENQSLLISKELENTLNRVTSLELEKEELMKHLESSQIKTEDLNSKIQILNDENNQLLSNVAELRSTMTSAVDQRGSEIAELWKQHLAQRENDFQKLEQELRTQLSITEAKYGKLLETVQTSSKDDTSNVLTSEHIVSLQTKLQEKDDYILSLQNKYAEIVNELNMLRSEMEVEKTMYENKLLVQQDEYEKQIEEQQFKSKQALDTCEQSRKKLENELATVTLERNDLKQEITVIQSFVEDSESKLLELTNQIRVKDSEIYQKTHDYTITLTQRNEEFENIRQQLIEYEKKLEELSYEKESELAVLRLKMHENDTFNSKMLQNNETEKSNVTETLNAKIIECTNLNKQILDLNKILQDYSAKMSEMQTVLENQEIEIVTLKDELNHLQDLIKISSSKVEKHVTFASDTKPGRDEVQEQSVLNKELLDAVPRAELDLALYMLHQRDVRCEELTMELTQLLEERDTLQLRLSDSIRSNEELKSICKTIVTEPSTSSTEDKISELPSSIVDKQQQIADVHQKETSRSSSISDPDGEKPKLQAKLSELRSVKHSRDVRLRQDSEQRQMDLRLLQRDVANLPPEAVDQLAQAHHTLSRDTQSTSTVLLNWLRGKSTPKVVHM